MINLPNYIEKIIFNEYRSIYNQSIDNLPNGFIYLELGFKFNKQV